MELHRFPFIDDEPHINRLTTMAIFSLSKCTVAHTVIERHLAGFFFTRSQMICLSALQANRIAFLLNINFDLRRRVAIMFTHIQRSCALLLQMWIARSVALQSHSVWRCLWRHTALHLGCNSGINSLCMA